MADRWRRRRLRGRSSGCVVEYPGGHRYRTVATIGGEAGGLGRQELASGDRGDLGPGEDGDQGADTHGVDPVVLDDVARRRLVGGEERLVADTGCGGDPEVAGR